MKKEHKELAPSAESPNVRTVAREIITRAEKTVGPTYWSRLADEKFAVLSPASERRVRELEAAALTGPYPQPLAPRGTCSSCDAYRGVMWTDVLINKKQQRLASCEECRSRWPKMREIEDLVRGWGGHQRVVADAGGWTPEMLREHHKALHPEEFKH